MENELTTSTPTSENSGIAPLLSCKAIMLSDSPNIGALAKGEVGPVKVKAGLMALISDLALFFNVGKQMNKLQVADTADLILLELKHLKFDDFKLCFRRLKAGHYGAAFDRMDGNVIMVALRAYDEERKAEYMRAQNEKRLAEEEANEKYVVEADGLQGKKYYLVSLGDDFDWTPHRALATQYSKQLAAAHCGSLKAEGVTENARWVLASKPTAEQMKAEKEKYPGIVEAMNTPKETGIERRTDFKYDAKRIAVEADTSLSDFERENKLREIAGLPALTPEQFALTQKIFEMNKKP